MIEKETMQSLKKERLDNNIIVNLHEIFNMIRKRQTFDGIQTIVRVRKVTANDRDKV
jgi:uncharacterized protein YfkK (UPF0435 family)